MMFWLLGCVCLLVFLYPILHDLYLIYIRGMPKGPLSLPVIGGVYCLNPKVPHLSLEKLGKQYGKIFSLRMGPMGRAVFLQDINLVNQMFESPDCHDRPDLPTFHEVNQGADGIGSCSYGSRWKVMTKMFHRGLARLSTTSVEEKATNAYHQLTDMFASKGASQTYYPRGDIIKACSAILSSMVYGIESESLDCPELKSRIHYHSMLMACLNPANPMNLIPILWKLPSPIKTKLLKCIHERDKLFDQSFENHAENYTGEIADVLGIITDFELNRESNDKNQNILTKDLFLSTWTFYLAGCDTTTDSSMWILLYLCVFPDVQEKMREEIDSVFGSDAENILQQKHKLNYTRAAILECLRLSSPIAIGLPNTTNRDLLIGGYNIPKGTALMACQWHIHHDESHWPDPLKLKPERFLDTDGTLYSNFHIFQKMPFIPFSRGKRPCLGQTIALDLLLIYVTLLLKKLTVMLPVGFKPDMSGKVHFNLRPDEFPIECIVR
ncbi:steroid 17-alpha-hydroxylase/17,20 lyase-like [Mercenaria mercenaria]|uniref:steroid 17-alpha-hydroxylase/17,20 lyase-like n=1 Tax=Mercenaria mercenaria TaxID=6596 RepID=UPI00234E378C|nr:steroid 17-alpha-hydroxylase/17,20 lyase-like [Mercenaria mercenaria]